MALKGKISLKSKENHRYFTVEFITCTDDSNNGRIIGLAGSGHRRGQAGITTKCHKYKEKKSVQDFLSHLVHF
jgi:hypothetical protein